MFHYVPFVPADSSLFRALPEVAIEAKVWNNTCRSRSQGGSVFFPPKNPPTARTAPTAPTPFRGICPDSTGNSLVIRCPACVKRPSDQATADKFEPISFPFNRFFPHAFKDSQKCSTESAWGNRQAKPTTASGPDMDTFKIEQNLVTPTLPAHAMHVK